MGEAELRASGAAPRLCKLGRGLGYARTYRKRGSNARDLLRIDGRHQSPSFHHQEAYSRKDNFQKAITLEFCFLQFRMICEGIALGCLLAHGDMPGTQASRLQREFSAERIMRLLQTLHPKFYPAPVVERLRKGHGKAI
jgi:hypothetical protein